MIKEIVGYSCICSRCEKTYMSKYKENFIKCPYCNTKQLISAGLLDGNVRRIRKCKNE